MQPDSTLLKTIAYGEEVLPFFGFVSRILSLKSGSE
jgi:hypothetical protein